MGLGVSGDETTYMMKAEGKDSMCKKGIFRKIGMMVLVTALCVEGVSYLRPVNHVYAEENITVKEAKAVLYSVKGTTVYNYPDVNATIVTTVSPGIPVEVLGVTSNGWFQVNINGKYYVPGSGLVDSKTSEVVNVYDTYSINQMIKGTFSYFENAKLRAFTRRDIEEMDDNTYIKYLDSFLKGNAMIDYCIIKDSGLVLKSDYEGKAQTDQSVAQKTMQQYLVDYRISYFNNSMKGPFRTKKDLIIVLNRAIRYGVKEFTAIYKNASIGSDADKMEELCQNIVEYMKEEQGVTFTYKKTYGTYKTEDGAVANGWSIIFSHQ